MILLSHFPGVISRKDCEEGVEPEEDPGASDIAEDSDEGAPEGEGEIAAEGRRRHDLAVGNASKAQDEEDRVQVFEECEGPDEHEHSSTDY